MEKLAIQLVSLQDRRVELQKKERKISETLIKLMQKKQKKEIILEKEDRVVRMIQPVLLEIKVEKIFKLIPLRKFLQVVEVKVGEIEKIIGREKLEQIAEKKEGKNFLRIEKLNKSVRP
jgi:uncharacterized membrane protein YkoI